MARRLTWGEMVRARMGAETLLTSDQIARRRLRATVATGLVFGFALELALPGFFLHVMHLLILEALAMAGWLSFGLAVFYLSALLGREARRG